MSRYIDKDLLITELEYLYENERLKYMGVFDTVNSIPEADVVEVKRGKWSLNEFDDWECSYCHKYVDVFTGKTNYCPNCGARMEGEDE